jgi:hypothetical protein
MAHFARPRLAILLAALSLAILLPACGGGGGSGSAGSAGPSGGTPPIPAGLVGSWRMVEQNGRVVDSIVDLSISAAGTYYFLVRRPDGAFLRDYTAQITLADATRVELTVTDSNCSFEPCLPAPGLRDAWTYILSGGELIQTSGDTPSVYVRR